MGLLRFSQVGVPPKFFRLALDESALLCVVGDPVEGHAAWDDAARSYVYSSTAPPRLAVNVFNFALGAVQIWDAPSTARAALLKIQRKVETEGKRLPDYLLEVSRGDRTYDVRNKGLLTESHLRELKKKGRLYSLPTEVGWLREMLAARR